MHTSLIHRAVAALAPALLIALAVPAQAQQFTPWPTRELQGSLVREGIPDPDPGINARLERYLHSRRATFLDWLPGGAMLVATRFGDVEQVHRVAAPLGAREQLTYHREPVGTAVAPQTAAEEGFVYLRDEGGNENAQLYYFRFADRSERLLTDGKSRHGSPVWSNDGRRIAFYGTGRDGVSHDIYVLDVAEGNLPRLLVAAQQDAWYPLDWSPDDSRLLLRRFVSIHESYLYVADTVTGTLSPLSDLQRKVGIHDARFAPDGRGIYYVSDEAGEFAELRHLDTTTRESRSLSAQIPWDIESFDVSADGRYVAFVSNEDGRSRLRVLDTVLRLDMIPTGVPDGVIESVRFDRTGRRIAMSIESAQAPGDVYVYDIESSAMARWTQSETGPLDASRFVAAEQVRFPTWDRDDRRQRMISAYLYRPRTPGPHPVLIYLHGGPESQYRPGFDAFFQFLANELEYAILAPNVRGSSGYGKTFLQLDNGLLREDAVRDVGSLIVWIGLQTNLDRNRVVVMGGSYGGYLSLASLAAYGDRLRGGISNVGISNFVTFLQNTAPDQRDLRRAEYGDERDPRTRSFLTRISPVNRASAIRRPVLIVQGLNDPRVPASEAEQIVARVRSRTEVWYLAAQDEGHGFLNKANRDAYLQTVASFLQRLK